MPTDSDVSGFLNQVWENLPVDSFFKPTEKHSDGKTEALANCRNSIQALCDDNIDQLPQVSLEFLIRVLKGRDIPKGVRHPKEELARKLRLLAKDVKKQLQKIHVENHKKND